MSGSERMDSGTARPSPHLDAATRRTAILAVDYALRAGWADEARDDLLEALGVLPYKSGGSTDVLGLHVFRTRKRRAVGDDDDMGETA